ncbi:MAG TPA: tetratricopeptide repeat protein [Candidatus Binatia bacterium]|jgi:tetratricopeptide (TPR) repeat protein|nr:tetratricopeptide repeat protein [Candidatus Binatia bacterium]
MPQPASVCAPPTSLRPPLTIHPAPSSIIHQPSSTTRNLLLGLLLVAATLLAYQPVWHAGFIWDDDVYVTTNKLLTAPNGLWRIWFTTDSPSQYFPLVYTAFRFEHSLWGLNPIGYHWVNLLVHSLNVLLVWRLLLRLAVPSAWLAAALFALHPVQVETVAWITEHKNLFSFFFMLLALGSWMEFIKEQPRSRWQFYVAALIFYLPALFSKTTACTLPAALFLVLWLQQKPITLKRLAQIVPFIIFGVGMGLLTMWWERYHQGTHGREFALGFLQRILIASRAVWFYLGKLLWPEHLAFSYPRWVINPSDPLAYAWTAAGVGLGALLYFARRTLGRGPEVAAVFFCATLSPMLGFIMLYTFRYTFVADHYQYAACLGPLALGAAGLATAMKIVPARLKTPWLQPVVCGLLLLGLGTLTWHQACSYKDVETLWRDTVAKNPDSWMARYNLSKDLLHRGHFDEALEEYRRALETGPNQVDSLVSVGNALFAKGRYNEAMDFYQRALQVNPDNPEAHINLAVILANRGRVAEAIEHDRKALRINPLHITGHVNLAVSLSSQGNYQEALEHYRKALELNPDQPLTHVNLAIALTALGRTNEATQHYRKAADSANRHASDLAEEGRLEESEAQYREAIRLIPNNAEGHCGLGALFAQQGKRDEARGQFAEALRLRADYPEAQRRLRELDSAPPKQ